MVEQKHVDLYLDGGLIGNALSVVDELRYSHHLTDVTARLLQYSADIFERLCL